MARKVENLGGRQFGRLRVVPHTCTREATRPGAQPQTYWRCRSDCGNPVLTKARASELKRNKIKSCGCLAKAYREALVARNKENSRCQS